MKLKIQKSNFFSPPSLKRLKICGLGLLILREVDRKPSQSCLPFSNVSGAKLRICALALHHLRRLEAETHRRAHSQPLT